jgi:hypothetical protein
LIVAGATALTLMPSRPRDAARFAVSDVKPAFAAA